MRITKKHLYVITGIDVFLLASLILVSSFTTGTAHPQSHGTSTSHMSLSGPQLVTNEYAFLHASAPDAVRSRSWVMTSGSLFKIPPDSYWTGIPDAISPDPRSTQHTDSAVFRMVSVRRDYGNVQIKLAFTLQQLVATPKTPANDWDGVHLMLRYQSQYQLYYVSLNRRDHTLIIKKKCPGGSSNGGTYYNLTNPKHYSVPLGTPEVFTAQVMNTSNAAVTVTLFDGNGAALLTGIDHGLGCAAITEPGGVGVRGDNAEFQFKVQVKALP